MSAINITSGSDADIRFEFRDGEGTALEVASPAILDADSRIADRLTATLVDGPGGVVNVFLEGTTAIPVRTYAFRLQVTLADGNTLASEKVAINVR